MTRKIPDTQISQLSELVAHHLGLHFPRDRWPDLERGAHAAAEACGCRHTAENYLQRLLSSAPAPDHMETLANHLTVGETYFFREKRSLEILEQRIVPDLLRTRAGPDQQLKIWSAGCATGEEPYSVAMALSRLMSGLNIEILATDLNTNSLRKASEGIYSDWSFRGVPSWVRPTYFEAATDNRWVIAPAIKKMVNFAPLNLMDDAHSPFANCISGVDVIFCRNVLMYFTPEAIRKVIRRFHCALAPDGWLIVSPTETSHELFAEFATVSFGDVTLYRKSDKRLPVTLALPVCNEDESSVQQFAWIVEATEPLETTVCRSNPETQATEAVAVTVEHPVAPYGEAIGLYEQGRYEEAGQAATALLSQNRSDAPAMLLLARIHANQGQLVEALAWCDKAIAADKMAAHAHYLRATILQEQGSLPEALLALKQAVYAEPQFVLGHFALGNLALKHQRRKESEKHFENALLLLARYEPEDIVPESEGLSAGRLREMIALPSVQVVIQTSRTRIRAPKQVGNLELSSR